MILKHCPCGALASTKPMWHNKTKDHNCIHHNQDICKVCRMLNQLDAFKDNAAAYGMLFLGP